jgi:hypothetical protein
MKHQGIGKVRSSEKKGSLDKNSVLKRTLPLMNFPHRSVMLKTCFCFLIFGYCCVGMHLGQSQH